MTTPGSALLMQSEAKKEGTRYWWRADLAEVRQHLDVVEHAMEAQRNCSAVQSLHSYYIHTRLALIGVLEEVRSLL
jgi:hypothetical protein